MFCKEKLLKNYEVMSQEAQLGEIFNEPTSGPKEVKCNALEGLGISFTGLFDTITQSGLSNFIKDKGGIAKEYISGRTDYLIIGEILGDGREINDSKLYKYARANEIPMLTLQEFEKFIEKKTGLKNFKLGRKILNKEHLKFISDPKEKAEAR